MLLTLDDMIFISQATFGGKNGQLVAKTDLLQEEKERLLDVDERNLILIVRICAFNFESHRPEIVILPSKMRLFPRTRGGTEAVSSVNGKTHGAICTVGFRILSSKPAQRPRYSLVTDTAAACVCTRSMPQSSRSLAATFGPLYSLVSSNGRNASCPSAVT